jgi:hypothetical protein
VTGSTPRADRGGRLLLALAGTWYLAFALRTGFRVDGVLHFSLFDDAMISMRYARNLAEGHGLVWNPGQAPVEGYSNTLWTLWMAVLHLAPVGPSLVSLLVMLSGIALLLTVAVATRRLALVVSGGNEFASRVAVLLAVLCYPLVFWTLRGFEVGLLAALLTGAAVQGLALRESWSARRVALLAGALALATLARDDAVPWALVVAVGAAVFAPVGRRTTTALVLVAAVAAWVALHTAFRMAYYGDPLPNTYYLKLTGVALHDRLRRGAWSMLLASLLYLWPLFLLAVPAAIRGGPRLRFLIMLAVTPVAYSVWVGGDAWEWLPYANRYVAVGLPVWIAAAAAVLARARAAPRDRLAHGVRTFAAVGMVASLAVAAALVFNVGGPWSPWAGYPPWVRFSVGVPALVFAAAVVVLWPWEVLHAARPRPMSVRVAEMIQGAPARSAGTLVGLAIACILWGPAIGHWAVTSGAVVRDDAHMATLGVGIRRATRPEAVIAVVWAGAIPYFAERRAVDLMGKSDLVIAREPPRGPFYPGHNKWDLAYSVGWLRPDVVVQVFPGAPADSVAVAELGYDIVPGGFFVRRGSAAVDRSALSALRR